MSLLDAKPVIGQHPDYVKLERELTAAQSRLACYDAAAKEGPEDLKPPFTKLLRILLCDLSIAIGRWEAELFDTLGPQKDDLPTRVPTQLLRSIESFMEFIDSHERYISTIRAALAACRVELAAARAQERIYYKALVKIAEHYTDTALAAKHMSAHARMVLSGTGNSADYVWSTASALNTPEQNVAADYDASVDRPAAPAMKDGYTQEISDAL